MYNTNAKTSADILVGSPKIGKGSKEYDWDISKEEKLGGKIVEGKKKVGKFSFWKIKSVPDTGTKGAGKKGYSSKEVLNEVTGEAHQGY